MIKNNNPLIFLSEPPTSHSYSSHQTFGSQGRIPKRNRASHSQKLIQELNEAFEKDALENKNREVSSLPCREGLYLEFESHPDFDLITKSLDSKKEEGIRLLNIREFESKGETIYSATVYVPKGLEQVFLKKLEDYAQKDTPKGKPKNALLIESIEKIKLAVTESFWQSNLNLFPKDKSVWCEAWLRVEQNLIPDDIVYDF